MPGKAPAQQDSAAVESPDAFAQLLVRMEGMATLDENSKQVSGESIIPILEAETMEEMWDADEMPRYNAQTISGCAIEIAGFDVKYSPGNDEKIVTPFIAPKSGRQMYLLVSVRRIARTGEENSTINLPEIGAWFIFNTSARNVVGKLFWMLLHGCFDDGKTVVCVVKGTGLSGGRSVEKLKEYTGPIAAEVISTEDPPF